LLGPKELSVRGYFYNIFGSLEHPWVEVYPDVLIRIGATQNQLPSRFAELINSSILGKRPADSQSLQILRQLFKSVNLPYYQNVEPASAWSNIALGDDILHTISKNPFLTLDHGYSDPSLNFSTCTPPYEPLSFPTCDKVNTYPAVTTDTLVNDNSSSP